MVAILHALATPDSAFNEERTYRVSRVLLLLSLFLLHSVGSELVAHFYTTPYVMGLVAQQRETESGQFSFGPPGGQGGQHGPAARQAAQQPMAVAQAVGVVVQSLVFVLLSLVLWWLLIIFVQFLGGEEAKTEGGPHRNSKYLVTYAWFPLALRRLLEGILVQLQDPSAAWSAATLADYQRASAVNFSPLALLKLSSLPAPVTYLAYNLTDPFFLWFLFVIVYGGRTVFRLSVRGAAVLGGFVVVLLLLLRLTLASIGIQTGV